MSSRTLFSLIPLESIKFSTHTHNSHARKNGAENNSLANKNVRDLEFNLKLDREI